MLPTYELQYQLFKTPSQRNVELTRMNTKVKRLSLLQLEQGTDKFTVATQIVKSCLRDPKVFDKLTVSDLMYVFVKIYILSHGNDFEFSYKCSKCDKLNEDKVIDLEKSLVVRPFTQKSFSKLSDEVEIAFKPLTISDTLKIKKKTTNHSEQLYLQLIYSIKAIKYKGKTHKNFTIKEVEQFIDSLPIDLFDKLVEIYNEVTDKCYVESELVCEHCQNKSILLLEEIDDFFV